jgi:uncharacterized protein
MKVIFDPEKRRQTLIHRGLDMTDADLVLSENNITFEDQRNDYGEVRYITIGMLEKRMVYVAWTMRDGAHRIISMRKANDREQKKYGLRLGGPG